MPFIPHTLEDQQTMLEAIGVNDIEQLFDEIPKTIPTACLDDIPEGKNEVGITRTMIERAPRLQSGGCFIGAGAYDHHVPAMVWDVVGRGEFYTAYTPYQAEASQGTLQLVYEYQSMMAHLMGMEVSNASLYGGATAVAEAVLMALRIKRQKAKRVIVPTCVHPSYRKVLKTVLHHAGVVLEELIFEPQQGTIALERLQAMSQDDLAAVIIPQPNFFGALEDVDALTNQAHAMGALVIAAVNPMAMALLKEPGSWGNNGADIVCGEGQPLGVPLASGGPYFGFLCTRKQHVRQLPGRIVGRTVDQQGRIGYTLTLQAREQHIRRAKATSNICTNQGLLVTAATIYMALLGGAGMKSIAAQCHTKAAQLKQRLATIDGVEIVFAGPIFHEFVIRLNKPVEAVQKALLQQGIHCGYSLKADYPQLGECLLVCVTETKTAQDLERYQQLLSSELT